MKLIPTKHLPNNVDAITRAPFVFVRPSKAHSRALRAHESVHIKQVYRTLYLFYPLYLLSSRLRLRWEAEAFAASVRNGRSLRDCAKALSTYYRLDLTQGQALEAIRKALC